MKNPAARPQAIQKIELDTVIDPKIPPHSCPLPPGERVFPSLDGRDEGRVF